MYILSSNRLTRFYSSICAWCYGSSIFDFKVMSHERHDLLNRLQLACLFGTLLKPVTKKTYQMFVSPVLCMGLITGLPSQKIGDAKSVCMTWRPHGTQTCISATTAGNNNRIMSTLLLGLDSTVIEQENADKEWHDKVHIYYERINLKDFLIIFCNFIPQLR